MASLKELQDRINELTKKFGETSPISNEPVKVQVGMKRVGSGGRGQGSGVLTPVYQNINQSVGNPEYQKIGQDLAEARNEYQERFIRDEGTYNVLAQQIASLGGGGGQAGIGGMAGQPQYNEALAALQSDRNFGASDLSTRLNFQVSDDQILNDYNQSKLNRLNQLVNQGNAQIAGITERLNTARNLLNSLPEGDPRRTSSDVVIKQLQSDLTSVQSGVADATSQIQNFKPITPGSEEALKQIVAFREYIQLPEEKAAQQLRQIDPDTYRTAVGLGQRYRQMAMEPLPETTTEPTEQLRQTIEQEALNQLRLGSTIGAEERRGYEQAVRAAQTARGNIFGLGPAVQEAATLGAAGEQRKLARYGAAQQFLASGETTGAAQARDLALRDALTQQRLGAAAGFIAGGPSISNLAQARTAQQQGAFQNYIQATQPMPGQFGQAPSTAQPFFQIAEQAIPVALTGEFNKLYGSQADYAARTYGAQVQAIASQRSGASQFADIAGGVGGLLGKIAPGGIFCWVAREVYGEDNPKWLQFREWMLTKASDNLRNYYIEYGERIAKSIRNKPKIKALIRKWMDSKIETNGEI
jgi:hypothetical protein